MSKRLSNAIADKSSPAEKRYVVWDSELPAFGLRVETSGSRSWVVYYRAAGGGRSAPLRMMVLGRYPVLAAPQARELAKDILADVRRGLDPAVELAGRRREMTIADAIDFYE